MLLRLRYGGRRLQNYLKVVVFLLIGIIYFTFLFRQSLHAFEQNKEKAEKAAAILQNSNNIDIGKTEKVRSIKDIQLQTLVYRLPPKTIIGIGHNELIQWQRQPKITYQELNAPTKATDHQQLPPPAALAKTNAVSTLNPIYEYSEEIHSATERELHARREHLNEVCQQYNLQAHYPPNPWEFIISPGHNLVWCNVFKAASSTWMYYFNILGGYDIKFLQKTERQPLELARLRFPRPEIGELIDTLPSSISFLFVRDPFERILSAYRNKLEGGNNFYYKSLGHKIVKEFRQRPLTPGTTNHKYGPTFNEFLKFLIDQHGKGKQLDEHWAPIYNFCTPCSVNFTIIGKLETFQRDSEFIIRQAGLESLLLNKLPKHKLKKIGNLTKGRKSQEVVEKYFSGVEHETLDQLLNIYRLDFELFDYDYRKYYEYIIPVLVDETSHNIDTIVDGEQKVQQQTMRQEAAANVVQSTTTGA